MKIALIAPTIRDSKYRPAEAPHPRHDAFFVNEQIYRDNQRDYRRDDAFARIRRRCQDFSGIVPNKIGNGRQGVLRKRLELFRVDHRPQRAFFQQFHQGFCIRIIVFRKQRDALYQLWNQRPDQKNHSQQRRQDPQRHREIPACISDFHFGKQLVIEEPCQGIENIGKYHAKEDGFEASEKKAHSGRHRFKIGQKHEECHADAGNHRAVIPFLFRQLIHTLVFFSFNI